MSLYEDLLQAAKLNPDFTDFKELRLAYTKSPEYTPHSDIPQIELRKSAYNALNQEDLQMAINLANRMLELNYLDIDAHLIAATSCGKIGDETRSTYHWRFTKGLLGSILQSGDGQSCQTAFTVINAAEEYNVLSFLGAELISQSLIEFEGHFFDLHQIHDIKSDRPAKIYFNIDLLQGFKDLLEPPTR